MPAEEIPVPAQLDIAQITADRRALERSTREVADRYDELLEAYPNQWIALQHSPPMIVSGETVAALSKAIKEHALNRNHLAIHFHGPARLDPRAPLLIAGRQGLMPEDGPQNVPVIR